MLKNTILLCLATLLASISLAEENKTNSPGIDDLLANLIQAVELLDREEASRISDLLIEKGESAIEGVCYIADGSKLSPTKKILLGMSGSEILLRISNANPASLKSTIPCVIGISLKQIIPSNHDRKDTLHRFAKYIGLISGPKSIPYLLDTLVHVSKTPNIDKNILSTCEILVSTSVVYMVAANPGNTERILNTLENNLQSADTNRVIYTVSILVNLAPDSERVLPILESAYKNAKEASLKKSIGSAIRVVKEQ